MQVEKTQKESLIKIPEEGCLGLLALGDVGLMIWREKKAISNKQDIKDETKRETA